MEIFVQIVLRKPIYEIGTFLQSWLQNVLKYYIFGILLPKLLWPTVRKNCSSDREKLLKFEAEGREFAKDH